MLKTLTETLIAIGPGGVLALALLDSSGIPVANGVDALLILLAVHSPRTAILSAVLAIVGSTLGNLFLFTAARKGGSRFVAKPGRAERFREWFVRYGLVTIFVPAFVPFPMPLKFFVVSAGVLGTRVSSFLTMIVLARVLRYGAEVWLGLALGKDSLGFLRKHAWHLAAAGVLLFIVLYLIVRFNDSTRRALRSPSGFPPAR